MALSGSLPQINLGVQDETQLVGYPSFSGLPEVAFVIESTTLSSAYLCWIYCVDESYDPALPSIELDQVAVLACAVDLGHYTINSKL
ncbi:hypothetical protein TNCV_4646171 [Trichonephila clavipes]|nr:hypothetical protein TNCV_4646171 [Trichonephila clavipes]